MNNRLIILSVPGERAARVLFSDVVLNTIQGQADVLVVTAIANAAAFSGACSALGFDVEGLTPSKPLTPWLRALYTFSELLRTSGYFCRYRQRGLQYYWSLTGKQWGDDGVDTVDKGIKRLLKKGIGVLGCWRHCWRIPDKLLGTLIYRCPALEKRLKQYQQVTLVQASSWDEQDRMLAWHARRSRFRTLLIPYTTDQLWVNGYLLCDYDAVCVQGPFEERCARVYHHVPEARFIRLGSMAFRAIDGLLHQHPELRREQQENAERVVLYAGVGRTYFPRVSEYLAVEALILANQQGHFGPCRLIYRPYALSAEERADIVARFNNRIELQWPEGSERTSERDLDGLIKAPLLRYIRGLLTADILVMSHTTSLCLDAAYLGCGVIANFADETGVLVRRETHRRFQNNGGLDFAPGMPIVHSIPDLISQVQGLLNDNQAAKKSRETLVREWDYPASPTELELTHAALFGEQPTAAWATRETPFGL